MQEEVRKMKSQGIKIIIGVGHYGYGADMRLAAAVDGLDILVGGHTHSFLYGGEIYIVVIFFANEMTI